MGSGGGGNLPPPKVAVPQDCSGGARDPDTRHISSTAGSSASFIAPDPCHLRLSIKRHHYPQPAPYVAVFRAARKPGTPPQTAAAIPWVPAGPGLGGAEEGGA